MSNYDELDVMYTKVERMRSEMSDMLHQLREYHDLGILEDTFTCASIDLMHIHEAIGERLI